MERTSIRERPGSIGAAVGLVLGVLVLGPALAPGYTLHYDLVFVPDPALGARALGTDGSVPRAVPNDLLVALAGLALPGWLVQKLLLLGSFVLGGAGAGRLATTGGGAVAAATLWAWNPWVGERLGIGHWGYLLGFALLPWVLAAAARLRRTGSGAPALVATLTASALAGSTPGVLATLLALVVILTPGGRAPVRPTQALLVVGISLLANAAWWYPFLRAAPRAADPEGVTAFAAAADTPFGVVGSLILGGGLWHDRSWFLERTTWPVAAGAVVAVVALLVVAVRQRSWWGDPLSRGATLAGAVGLLVAAAGALPGSRELLEVLITTVPGGGLLRDGQKFAALWVLLLVLAAATVVDRMRAERVPAVITVVAVIWPIATLPTLAWGHLGAWGSVDWPTEYGSVTERLSATPEPVAVLPWSTYRRYGWNEDRVVLDPWNRFLPQRVVSDDRLALRGEDPVAGEDPAAAAVAGAVSSGADVIPVLRDAGVRWVVVDTTQPDPEGSVPDFDGPAVLTAGTLEVHDLGPAPTPAGVPPSRAAGLVFTGAAVLLSLGLLLLRRRTET